MRKLSVLLGTFALACALSAAWSGWQLRAERERVASLEQQLAAARAATTPAPASARPAVATALVDVQTPSPAPDSPTNSQKADDAVEKAQAARDQELREQMRTAQQREREMMRDPEYRQSRMDDWRRRHAQTRADAIRVVGLTPEQADRLVELIIERNFSAMELAGIPGETMNQETQADLKRINEQHEEKLSELLGSEDYQRWQWYQKTAAERGEVSMFRAQLSTTSTPLQEHQADALVDALYVERRRRDREYDEYTTAAGITNRYVVAPPDRQRWIELEKDSNRRIHNKMSGSLMRDQLESLDAMLTANVAPAEAALRLQLEGKMAKSN